jgi:hypothetical protein
MDLINPCLWLLSNGETLPVAANPRAPTMAWHLILAQLRQY